MSTFSRSLGRVGLCLALATALGLGAAQRDAWARGKRSSHKVKGKKASKNTRFYDFDDLLIDGEFRKPATLYTRALKSPRFERLLRLQKSFLDRLLQTARYPSLRWLR